MQKFIARANIERFRRLIAEQPDRANRPCLERMLAEEQAKLRSYEAGPESADLQESVSERPGRTRP